MYVAQNKWAWIPELFQDLVRLKAASELSAVVYDGIYSAVDDVVYSGEQKVSEEIMHADMRVLEAIDAAPQQGMQVKIFVEKSLRQSEYFELYLHDILDLNGLKGFSVLYVDKAESADIALTYTGKAIEGIEKSKVFVFSEAREIFLKELLYFSHFYRVMLARSLDERNGVLVINFNQYQGWVIQDECGFGLNADLVARLDAFFRLRKINNILRIAA